MKEIMPNLTDGDKTLMEKLSAAGRSTVSAELKNKICGTACHEKPKTSAGCAAAHWNTRCLAKKFGVGGTTVHAMLRERGIKPRIVKTFKFSTDEHFEEKLTDVAGLYLNPPDNAIVLCAGGLNQSNTDLFSVE